MHLPHQQRKGRVQKWHLPESPSLEKVPPGPCASSRHIRMVANTLFHIQTRHLSNCCFLCWDPEQVSPSTILLKSISNPYSLLGPLDMSPTGFQRQMFLGPHLSSAGLKSWGAWCRVQIPQGDAPDLRDPSLLSLAVSEGLARPLLCLSYPAWCGPLMLSRRGGVQLVSRTFTAEIAPYIEDLVWLWEEVSSDSSSTTILDHLPVW